MWLCAQRLNILHKSWRLSSISRILLLMPGSNKKCEWPQFSKEGWLSTSVITHLQSLVPSYLWPLWVTHFKKIPKVCVKIIYLKYVLLTSVVLSHLFGSPYTFLLVVFVVAVGFKYIYMYLRTVQDLSFVPRFQAKQTTTDHEALVYIETKRQT